jgi:hypothetical protein
MKIIDEIFRSFGAVAEAMPDLGPQTVAEAKPDHRAKLREAAQRYGKPFKCAATALPREVLRYSGRENAQHIVTTDSEVVPPVPSACILVPTSARRAA